MNDTKEDKKPDPIEPASGGGDQPPPPDPKK